MNFFDKEFNLGGAGGGGGGGGGREYFSID